MTESVDTYNRVCARMAQSTGQIVVSVEYRLAPEYRFPTALLDCYAAAEALYTGKLPLETVRKKSQSWGTAQAEIWRRRFPLWPVIRDSFAVERQILILSGSNNCYTEASPYPP